jgi:hypothetical protein
MADYIINWLLNSRENVFIIFYLILKPYLIAIKKHRKFTKNSFMNLTQEDWVSNLEADANAVILDVRTWM